jgi:hypothetical protein
VKKLLAPLMALALIIAGTSTSSAGVIWDLNTPTQGIKITESWTFASHTPILYGAVTDKSDSPYFICKTLQSKECTDAVGIMLINHLPVCTETLPTNCILNIYAVDSAGKKSIGSFQKYVSEFGIHDYEASPINNLPQGKGQGGLWQIPGVINSSGSDTYYATTMLNGWLSKPGGTVVSNERFSFNNLQSAIFPATERQGAYQPSILLDSSRPGWKQGQEGAVAGMNNSTAQDRDSCLVFEAGSCVITHEFPEGYRFGMTLNLSDKLRGWFHGRIFTPNIDIQTGANNSEVINVEALPVTVPTLLEKVPTSTISQGLRDYLSQPVFHGVSDGYMIPGNSGTEAFESAALWLPILKDKATTSKTYWNFHTLDMWNEGASVGNCSQATGDLAGIVTTNSLVYSAGAPTYNSEQESLDYKLLSPHYQADGTVAIGTYDLVLRGDVARCIYGFSKAPIKASVSIISAEGEAKVATVTINEKDGWLYLSAKGFTFSSPTIRVKLSQTEPVATPTPTPSPSTSKATKKATLTITCKKGKALKKVSGASPICPKGYKKVA